MVTFDQLLATGASPDMVYRMARKGRLMLVRKGVYRVAGTPVTWEAAAMAAVLACGPGAVLSHFSAAAVHGLVNEARTPPGFHVSGVARSRAAGVVMHQRRLDPADRAVVGGLPVTTVERTLIDLAGQVPDAQLGRWLDETVRRRLTTLDRFAAVASRLTFGRRRPGAAVPAVLRDRGAGYVPGANDWERAMDDAWVQMGLPESVRQYPIRVAGGRTFRPDRVILDARITVDWNGREWHGTRSAFDGDSERRNLLSAAGYHPLDFTTRTPPRLICSTVLAVYRQQMGRQAG
jgi:hypothetical protein